MSFSQEGQEACKNWGIMHKCLLTGCPSLPPSLPPSIPLLLFFYLCFCLSHSLFWSLFFCVSFFSVCLCLSHSLFWSLFVPLSLCLYSFSVSCSLSRKKNAFSSSGIIRAFFWMIFWAKVAKGGLERNIYFLSRQRKVSLQNDVLSCVGLG